MSIEEPTPSAGRRLVVILMRLLLVAAIGGAIGAGVYFGVPLAFRGLVEPVRLNAERVDELENELDRTRADLTELAERSAERSAQLEAASVETRELLTELRAGIELELTDLGDELDGLAGQLDALDRSLGEQVDSLDQALEAQPEPDAELQRELTITRALVHLLRARLWLVENDQQAAAGEVQAALDMLEGIDGVASAVARLGQALAELGTTPLVAAEDLEIAWMLLLSPQPAATAEPPE